MIVLGITGPTGAGKTTASAILKERGIKVIDTDILAREIVGVGRPALGEIEAEFGSRVILEDGGLDRRALAKIVFSSQEALLKLNEITHKYIREEAEKIIAGYDGKIIGIDGAALIESGIASRCTKVLSVLADPEIRKKRIMVRDSMSEQDALERMAAQKNNDFYIENSDYIAYNNDEVSLNTQLDKIINELRSMS